jgi:hypothetical protein
MEDIDLKWKCVKKGKKYIRIQTGRLNEINGPQIKDKNISRYIYFSVH